jgi:hypothetical protein
VSFLGVEFDSEKPGCCTGKGRCGGRLRCLDSTEYFVLKLKFGILWVSVGKRNLG